MRLSNTQLTLQVMSKNPALKKLVTDLNTKKQLEFGELSDGSILPNYSWASQVFFGKPDIPMQLKDTGEFWRSFNVVLEDDGFIIEADGQKDDTNLFVKYGEDVAGLNDKNMSIFINAFLQKVYDVLIHLIVKAN